MKKLWMALAVLTLSAVATFAQASATEQAVLQLEKYWVAALVKADTAKLETLYADTLVYTHSSGSVDDKAKYIANMKVGTTKYVSIDREDIKANVYGNSAVATCKVTMKLKTNGEDRTIIARMIHVYAKVKNRWQMVAHQTTRLP